MTVFNESANITRLLESLAGQTRPPDEIVICDGGSTDGTPALIDAFLLERGAEMPPVRVLLEPGANISRGRNVAIAAAQGPIIAATDAGVRLAPDWLEKLVAPWDGDANVPAVAGFFLPDADDVFTTAMAATVLPLPEDIDPDTFLPSSRSVAFTKATWAAAGGYPEWLDYCEDLLFDFAVNAQRSAQRTTVQRQYHGGNAADVPPAGTVGSFPPGLTSAFIYAPDARVYFRPRTSLRAFWRQYYLYARGDGKADLWRKRHAVRYATYLVVLPALLGHGFFGFFAKWLGWVGLLVGVWVYCRRPWQRLRVLGADLSLAQRVTAAAWVPVIRVVGDVAKMAGYPVGLCWRWRRRNDPDIHWRERQSIGGSDRENQD